MKHTALLLLLVSGACNDKPLMEHTEAQRVRDEGNTMGEWMPKGVLAAWQGAWLLRFVDEGPLVAVNVEGEKATVFDGITETQVPFKIIEPCAVAIDTRELQFLIRDGKVVSGHGAAGMRKGEKAIVCGDGRDPGAPEEGVYLVNKNRCKTWKRDAKGAWSSRDGVCVWANARGDDLLDVGTEHYSSTVVVKGDFLEERNFTRSSKDHTKATSWDAAKTMVTANMKPPSTLEAAKAAGGVVGDTKTIAGLHATYANSPTPLVGIELEVPGVLVEMSTQTVHGKVAFTLAVIADPATPKAKPLVCKMQGVVNGIKPGDRVVAKGDIDTTHEYARLSRCQITKQP